MKKQIENERSLHRAELELLQAQINPHFLYNTLDSISILAESGREEDVVDMVNNLSTFFRNSLSRGEDIITLRAELAQATSYLEIRQIRYSDILNYEIHVPEELQDHLVPKLILQPLIENALYHGIKNRRGRGTITISGESVQGDIMLKVQDNGAGMTSEQLKLLNSGIYAENQSGLGLKNVQQRIRLYCGSPYGLSFESSPGEGTSVTVLLCPLFRRAAFSQTAVSGKEEKRNEKNESTIRNDPHLRGIERLLGEEDRTASLGGDQSGRRRLLPGGS